MEVVPMASDSLGVRSMATYVETKDCKILIDPSAALGPKRYGLPPAEQEMVALEKTKNEIAKTAKQCDILTISHYHYDHYDPSAGFYKDKTIFAKDINENINKSQQKRGADFKKILEDSCDLIYCDDSKHNVGNTELIFSPPFFHGPENVRLGYVIMTTIDDGEKRVLHASDVQGPVTKSAKEYIISQSPDLLIMDGPPTIFLGWKFSMNNLQDAADNLVEIKEKLDCDIILDHHLLRDLNYKKIFPQPYQIGGKKVKTFAEYLGKENNVLEAHRKELWGK
ncbi:MBL fold metallo-hydrolase [candidate division WOR-3 bacterium]|nr:MBL fold metallo-hydrolase [candidate division WOR-3 bacterium]